MCWEPCLICEQCEKFKNGCSGQFGTFFRELCPCYPNSKVSISSNRKS